MAPQSPQLVMRTGPHPGKTYPIEKDEIQIGRDVNNDVIINDAEVSRHHARILRQAGVYQLEDLGSTNGTFVNGERVSGTRPLRPGELITLGENVSLAFEAAPFDPDATVAAAPAPGAHEPIVQPPREAYSPPRPVYVSPPQPQPRESYAQPQSYQPQPARMPEGVFPAQVAPGPVETFPATDDFVRPRRNWIVGGCVILAVLLCLALFAILWYIDANLLWCQIFPFIPTCN